MTEHLHKEYRSNEEGKRSFTDEVILPLVLNENHFENAIYVTNDMGEYIMLYRHGEKKAAYAINVTANSIEALARDYETISQMYRKRNLGRRIREEV